MSVKRFTGLTTGLRQGLVLIYVLDEKLKKRLFIVWPVSDRQDNVVDTGLLEDVVDFVLRKSGHVFAVDLKNLPKDNNNKIFAFYDWDKN